MSNNRLLRHVRHDHSALAENTRHAFAANHALSFYKQNTVYSFIPKNACSTMRFTLALANGAIAAPSDIDWIHKNNRTFVATKRDLATADYTFAILRCPYSRLASVFLDKLLSEEGIKLKFPPPKSRLARRFKRSSKISSAAFFGPNSTFRDFVHKLSDESVRNSNIHWRPQIHFLVYEHYDDLFQLEEFSRCIKTVEEKTGLKIADARKLTRHGTDQFNKSDHKSFADVPIAELRKMKAANSVPTHSALFDDDLKDVVSKIYADDLALYSDNFGTSKLIFS